MKQPLPVLIDRPGAGCSLPASDRLCLASACEHALTPRMGRSDYHFTRCARDGGAEAFERVPEPPRSGCRRTVKLATVIPLRRLVDRMQLCSDPFAERPISPLEPRVRRWSAIVGRPRVARARVLSCAPARSRRRALRPAWRRGWICPHTECRYHLADFSGDQIAPGCALVIAENGGHTLTAIGVLTGFTRERIRQIEDVALRRKGLERLREFAPDDVDHERHVLSSEERVLRLLSAGSATTTELADGTGMEADRVRDTLRRLGADGQVRGTVLAHEKGLFEWSLVEASAASPSGSQEVACG